MPGASRGPELTATPRIRWSSPLPPTRSGVADYAAELVPEISRLVDVEVVAPPGWDGEPSADWLQGARIVSAVEPTPPGTVELLHLGNNPYHRWVAARLRERGGLAVIHDTVLHHLLVEEAAADDDWGRFATELRSAYGEAGCSLASARRWGYVGRLDPFLFPASAAYLRLAQAAIVHSDRAREETLSARPELPVAKVPLAVAALPSGDRAETRSRLGVADTEVLAVHLGFLTPAKGLEVILRALVAARSLGVRVKLLVVGEGDEQSRLEERAGALGLGESVHCTGFVSAEQLGRFLAAADLGLVTRYPTAGETSAAALRCLAAGTPVAVSGYRQFLELPAEAAWRIEPGERGAAGLVRLLAMFFAADPALRAASRLAARRCWQDGGHEPAAAARHMVAAVVDLVSGWRGERSGPVPRR